MSGSFKICPICSTPNTAGAVVCRTCGAALKDVEIVTRAARPGSAPAVEYDFRYGENDLQERPLSPRSQTAFTMIVVALLAFALGGAAFAVFTRLNEGAAPAAPQPLSTPSLTPALLLPTVTAGPPTGTATFTPAPTFTPSQTFTPEPCIQEIFQGDSLLGAIARCGHRDREVLATVVALNNLPDANSIQIGQRVVIPWPTPTPDPLAIPTATAVAAVPADQVVSLDLMSLDESIDPFAPTATPTLPPGVMWHRIAPDENIVVIAIQYNANAKVLSELNPEMDFARCEFGERFGGPECIVPLFVGQLMRVPAPTPTPTLSPTPDPNATATPTATPTYNEPNIVSPPDRQFFGRDELVTLRWVPTGTLLAGELYRVDVEDVTTGIVYTALTREISLIVPPDWQGREQARHEFRWTVGVVSDAHREVIRFQTRPFTFVWQGLVESDTP
ncbi:MAG: hypothetical protein MUE40_05525 [Anaerolineae bacterium]|nr:hypothetical protein [Anaerolineae bacterium]